MSSKNKTATTKKTDALNLDELRKPWIKKKTGFIVISVVSVAFAILTAAQIVMGSGDWGQAILWGVIFGAMVWIVFFGMSWIQGLLHGKPNTTIDDKK